MTCTPFQPGPVRVLGLLDFGVKIKGLLDYLPQNLRIMDSLKIKGLKDYMYFYVF